MGSERWVSLGMLGAGSVMGFLVSRGGGKKTRYREERAMTERNVRQAVLAAAKKSYYGHPSWEVLTTSRRREEAIETGIDKAHELRYKGHDIPEDILAHLERYVNNLSG